MAIDPTQSSTAATAAAPPTANPKSALGKDAFMKLLVAQLKQQDPLNPASSTDMVAQIAQLTSVEKLDGINQTLSQMQSQNSSMAGTQSTGLLGRQVKADGSRISVVSGMPAHSQFEVSAQASSVTATIRDSANNIVRVLDFGATAAGTHGFQWDGTDAGGNRLPDGRYSFDVAAQDAAGHAVSTSTQVSGLVTQVTYNNGTPELDVAGSRVQLGDLVSISQ